MTCKMVDPLSKRSQVGWTLELAISKANSIPYRKKKNKQTNLWQNDDRKIITKRREEKNKKRKPTNAYEHFVRTFCNVFIFI